MVVDSLRLFCNCKRVCTPLVRISVGPQKSAPLKPKVLVLAPVIICLDEAASVRLYCVMPLLVVPSSVGGIHKGL